MANFRSLVSVVRLVVDAWDSLQAAIPATTASSQGD
jgi:hypothetical protein